MAEIIIELLFWATLIILCFPQRGNRKSGWEGICTTLFSVPIGAFGALLVIIAAFIARFMLGRIPALVMVLFLLANMIISTRIYRRMIHREKV